MTTGHQTAPQLTDYSYAMNTDATAPRTLCLLRLSAIGDTCHVVPLLLSLQAAWPETRFTWVIGKTEAKLMRLISGVEFIEYDKRTGLAGLLMLRKRLQHREFDVLLDLQHSLRASAVSLCIRANRRIGFDRARARELQWLFTNERVAARRDEHVLDSFLGFADALGVSARVQDWILPLPVEAVARAGALIPPNQRTLVISPCASHPLRNWSAEKYARVADHASRAQGMRVLLCGGRSPQERAMADAILAHARTFPVDLVGQDTLPELLAVLARATVLLSPDSGPVHMATLVNTPVIGLYAATRLTRSGPYRSQRWCVDAYDRAAQQFLKRKPQQLEWTRKIELPGVMDLIRVDQVIAQLRRLLVAVSTGRAA
ncbi:MAG: glycosyltransferase family 9 protein [Pseudomonadota bacterium]